MESRRVNKLWNKLKLTDGLVKFSISFIGLGVKDILIISPRTTTFQGYHQTTLGRWSHDVTDTLLSGGGIFCEPLYEMTDFEIQPLFQFLLAGVRGDKRMCERITRNKSKYMKHRFHEFRNNWPVPCNKNSIPPASMVSETEWWET